MPLDFVIYFSRWLTLQLLCFKYWVVRVCPCVIIECVSLWERGICVYVFVQECSSMHLKNLYNYMQFVIVLVFVCVKGEKQSVYVHILYLLNYLFLFICLIYYFETLFALLLQINLCFQSDSYSDWWIHLTFHQL